MIHPVRLHELPQVFGHQGIGYFIPLRRPSMIALINDKNGEMISPLARQRLPIVQRSEKTMQDNERVALPESLIIEFHKTKV